MGCQPDVNALPLSELPFKTKQLLSYLLNTNKIIPSDGPDKLPRDWRGLAHLIEIPNYIAASFHQYPDKTAKVLEIWINERTDIATVGKLLEFMQRLDRYDVHDDILNDLQLCGDRQDLEVSPQYQLAVQPNNSLMPPMEDVYNVITYDDTQGQLQIYDAFILYADEDADFIDELYKRLGREFKFCTKDNLLAGHATQYTPVAQLIAQRCRYIILVCSPHFVKSPANSFYTDYAQAVSIESKNESFERKIIPVVYKTCDVPVNLGYYHKLYYKREDRSMYDFWQKLSQSLRQSPSIPSNRLNGSTSVQSSLNIVEMSNSVADDSQLFLHPYKTKMPSSTSMNGLDTLKKSKQLDEEITSIDSISDLSINLEQPKKKKKKSGPMRWLADALFRKKSKQNKRVETHMVGSPIAAGGNASE